jgi:glutamyl-Q tRNA(Asp) synthetase
LSYIGRFAPSPTGPLHMGSLVSALASWLDAKANQGLWLIRIEDIDRERCQSHFSQLIIEQLMRCGLTSDLEIVYQSQRQQIYESYIKQIADQNLLYQCLCSRANILSALRHSNNDPQVKSLVYPGTCRDNSLRLPPTNQPFSLRVKTMDRCENWADRKIGAQLQNVFSEVGDFVIKRSDGPYSYQLCVVVDDIEQSVTHVVRGQDLADNTPRQNYLYKLFHHAPPAYLHVPLVKNKQGEKLSKQTFAPEIDLESSQSILTSMKTAAQFLELRSPLKQNAPLSAHLHDWTDQWSLKYPLVPSNP